MRSVVIEAPYKVHIEDRVIPDRKKGEALLRMLYGGICGTDLKSYRGQMKYTSYPRTPGHEFSAEIVEIDDNDIGLKAGMIVTGNPYFNCHHCYSCDRGMVNCCMTSQTLGVQREGTFSDYFTLPIERIYPGNGIDAKTLSLVEPFCISYHGVSRASIKPGEKVLIVGAGTIGVFASIAAKNLGAKVYICDISKQKVDYACNEFNLEYGFVNSSAEVFNEEVRRLTAGNGFDVTIEAVGLGSTYLDCINAAAFGGRMIQLGVGNAPVEFPFTMLQQKELTVRGSRNALKQDFMEVISMIIKDDINLDKVITKVFKKENAPEAFDFFDKNSATTLKVLLEF